MQRLGRGSQISGSCEKVDELKIELAISKDDIIERLGGLRLLQAHVELSKNSGDAQRSTRRKQ